MKQARKRTKLSENWEIMPEYPPFRYSKEVRAARRPPHLYFFAYN